MYTARPSLKSDLTPHTVALLFLFAWFIQSADLLAQNDADYRNILGKSNPFPHPIRLLIHKEIANPSDVALITKQLGAIVALAAHPEKGDVSLLIPYLDYPSSPIDVISVPPPTIHEDVAETKRLWPAFAAILGNPFAAQELSQYILDPSHPANSRVRAWFVLRYVNSKAFQDIYEKHIAPSVTNYSPSAIDYIHSIQDGSLRFTGILDVPF